MKVMCLADTHLGSGAAYADDRLADQAKVLAQVVQIIEQDEEIRLVLLAGDVFHRPRPTPATLLTFRRFTDSLAQMEIPTIAITGNAGHDIEAGDRPCALDLFESRWFRVSRRPELIWDFVDGVTVATLPSVPVSRLVSQADSVERGPIFDQAAEALLAIATEQRGLCESLGGSHKASILLGHWSVSGASLPNGLPVDSLSEPILDLASLERLNYDAMVFGHIHAPQRLMTVGEGNSNNGWHPAFYCGSPMNVDFGEPHEHGCWIIDTEAETTFVPLEYRPFLTIDYDFTDWGDHSIDWDRGILLPDEEDFTDAVVRVRYKATEEQHRRVDTAALKKAILDAGAHKVFQISAEIVKQDRARVQGVDENLEPSAALNLYV